VGEAFQELVVIDKDLKGELKKIEYLSVRYVPLTDRQSQLNKQL
jgi:protein-L-isoaspartate(D-aspartate) O-methyltransferase